MKQQIVRVKQRNPALSSDSFEEVVRFVGKQVGFYEDGTTRYTLFATPGGYRVTERNRVTEQLVLKPYTNGPNGAFPLNERVYGTFTQAEVAAGFPRFMHSVAGARDI